MWVGIKWDTVELVYTPAWQKTSAVEHRVLAFYVILYTQFESMFNIM